jgi:hypothetical protein
MVLIVRIQQWQKTDLRLCLECSSSRSLNREIVGDQHIVKDRATLDLPKVETNDTEVIISIESRIGLVVGVGNLGVHPFALVCGIGDLHPTLENMN